MDGEEGGEASKFLSVLLLLSLSLPSALLGRQLGSILYFGQPC